MNRSTCASQAQSPGAKDDARAEDLRSNTVRCTKRRVVVRPCSAAPGNAAQSNVAPPLNDGKSSPAETTTPLRPAKISRAASNSCAEHSRTRKEKGARKPPFFAAAQDRRRTNARHGHAPSLGGCGRRCGTAHSSDVGRYPSRLSAPHETMIGAFPFPGRRAQAGEPETRLFAGLAPHARAIFPAASSGKAPDPIFAPGDRLGRTQQFSGRSAAGEPGGQKRRQAAASGRGQRRKSVPRGQRHGQRHAGFRLNP